MPPDQHLLAALRAILQPMVDPTGTLPGRPIILAPAQTFDTSEPIPYLHIGTSGYLDAHQRIQLTAQITLHQDTTESDDHITLHQTRRTQLHALLNPNPPSDHLKRYALQLALNHQLQQLDAPRYCLQHIGPPHQQHRLPLPRTHHHHHHLPLHHGPPRLTISQNQTPPLHHLQVLTPAT
jgi:hypothetical protein